MSEFAGAINRVAYPLRITLKIAPDGSSTRIQLMDTSQLNTSRYPEPTDSDLLPGRIIPDGQGGVLATWTIAPSNPPVPSQGWHYYQASHVVGGVAASYDLPFTPHTLTFGQYPTLVLGENGTAFADGRTAANDGTNNDVDQVTSFDLNSGAPNWTHQAGTQSTLSIMAVLSDGSLAINDSRTGIVQIATTEARRR